MTTNRIGLVAVCVFALASGLCAVYVDDFSLWPATLAVIGPGAWFAYHSDEPIADRLDVSAGLRELSELGYSSAGTHLVIEAALVRWSLGDIDEAERKATDQAFYGISPRCWRRVLLASLGTD